MRSHLASLGRFPAVVGTRTVVLFDPGTGRVHHLHHALLFDGPGPAPGPHELEAVARRNAARRGPLPDAVHVLHLKDEPLPPGPCKVDLATYTLVPSADAGSRGS